MQPSQAKTTVYFDGSCPLCWAEIGHYRRADRSGQLCFVDVADENAEFAADLSRRAATRRFHVRTQSGQLLSGAAAFAEVWRNLPRWRWAARLAALPAVLTLLELGYRGFLPARPLLSRLFGLTRRSRRQANASDPGSR